jgi:hypothetical protein
LPAAAGAQAPPRPGQPYAEAERCADPSVIFCEDFNFPENFIYTWTIGPGNSTWVNPGLTTQTLGYVEGLWGRQINPVASYPTQPPGSPAGGHVWVANWDPAKGAQGNGATWGKLREPGGNYANGSAPARDIYLRFQYYVTDNYAWPGDPKTDPYYFGGSAAPVDNKIVFVFPPEGIENPTSAAYDAGVLTTMVWDPNTNARFTDALTVRYGDAGDNYKHYPMDFDASVNPQHMEYGPFPSTAPRNPGSAPQFGKIFRFDTNRWYSIELRYMLSSGPGVPDGVVEVWVDGVKVYSASDLATCGGGLGDCSGIGAIYVGAYHNGADSTAWNGQQVLDNLVISRSYIGPPGTGAPVQPGAVAAPPAIAPAAAPPPAPPVAAPAPAPAPAPPPAPAAPPADSGYGFFDTGR